MYCSKCGAQNDDQSLYCKRCGSQLIQTSQNSVESPFRTHRTSGFAIAAFVLGIVGLVINPLSIPAIVFGAIAINQTGKDPELGGRGRAISGLVLGAIVAFIWIVILIFFSAVYVGYGRTKILGA